MQADFSRTTFDPAKHFSAVLAQQGRVSLDADFNEQAAILLRQLRTAITDIVGPAGAPAGDNGGFEVSAVTGRKPTEDLAISAGRMYVGGVLIENDTSTTYFNQPDGFLNADDEGDQLPRSGSFVLYLRVWERLVTAAQDPSIREVALGDPGPDTAARARTVWQVAAHAVTATSATGAATQLDEFTAALKPTGQLKADAKTPPVRATSRASCRSTPGSAARRTSSTGSRCTPAARPGPPGRGSAAVTGSSAAPPSSGPGRTPPSCSPSCPSPARWSR